MKKKIFDATTAMKIISDYADKINNYMKENQNLKSQLEDLKITLNINKELLFKYISTNVQQTEQITLLNDYKNDNLRLLQKNEQLHNDKTFLEKKLYKLQQDVEDNLSKTREDLEKIKEENFVLRNKVSEKETLVIFLRKEMDKVQNSSNKVNVKELVVSEPTKANVDLINELNFTRELIGKVSKLLNVEKIKNEKLEVKVNSLLNQINMAKSKEGDDERVNTTEIYLKKESESLFEIKQKKMSSSFIHENKHPTLNDDKEDIMETISFSDEELNTLGYIEGEEVESPVIKFPDKVNYSSNSGIQHKPLHGKSLSLVPKLDLKIIQSKYQSTANKSSQPKMNKATEQDETKQALEKVKLELKIAQKTIQNLKSRVEKYKKAYKDVKVELKNANENTKNANNKIELLEIQIKKFINAPSTDVDTASNKRIHSTTNNTGRSHEDYESVEIKKMN